jgi:predicted Rossmann fold nucleotide-binding protein DprA/Smf involved in DNA uptake
MGDNEAWLKTSSMPNIRPKSFKRLQRRFSKHSKFNPVKLDISKMGLNKNNEEVIDDIERAGVLILRALYNVGISDAILFESFLFGFNGTSIPHR